MRCCSCDTLVYSVIKWNSYIIDKPLYETVIHEKVLTLMYTHKEKYFFLSTLQQLTSINYDTIMGIVGFITRSFHKHHQGLRTFKWEAMVSLQWRHNKHDCVSNHKPRDCLLNRLFRRRSKKTSKPGVTGLGEGTGEFPSQRASNAKMFPFDEVIMSYNQNILRMKEVSVSWCITQRSDQMAARSKTQNTYLFYDSLPQGFVVTHCGYNKPFHDPCVGNIESKLT